MIISKDNLWWNYLGSYRNYRREGLNPKNALVDTLMDFRRDFWRNLKYRIRLGFNLNPVGVKFFIRRTGQSVNDWFLCCFDRYGWEFKQQGSSSLSIYLNKLPQEYWEGNWKARQKREFQGICEWLETHDAEDLETVEGLKSLFAIQEIPQNYSDKELEEVLENSKYWLLF